MYPETVITIKIANKSSFVPQFFLYTFVTFPSLSPDLVLRQPLIVFYHYRLFLHFLEFYVNVTL